MHSLDSLFSLAHVKWFTEVLPAEPEPLTRVISPVFLGGLLLSLAAMLALTQLNEPLQEITWVKRIHAGLERLKPYSLRIARLGLAIPLLAAGMSGYLFHYELRPIPPEFRMAQVILGAVMLMPGFSRVAAVAVGALGVFGISIFGLHGMMDYISWLGACYFIATWDTKYQKAAIPALYITTGISLAWGAVEKWVYPGMALDIVQHHGIPTFGFPPEAFLILAGWVELSVAYLLITGVLNRFLSIVLTGLFITTSMVFGPTEVLGHWQLHIALLIFLIEGTGALPTPVLWHKSKRLQLAFVGVTLVPFVAVMIGAYYLLQYI